MPRGVVGTRKVLGAARRILDTALQLGEARRWDALHLYAVADAMGLSIAEIHRHYGQKDDLAEGWFDRADAALLAVAQTPDWRELGPRQRLHRAILAWLDALAPHRRLTAEMLGYKLQPEHLHLQALGLTRVSRTVQWIRETACLPSVGWRRELEEVALTAILLGGLLAGLKTRRRLPRPGWRSRRSASAWSVRASCSARRSSLAERRRRRTA
ncbi:MAG: TetR/AcrR family transcriptional regulator [Chromatiaceae bacterium]|nr:TetR/AcrR family transcriptional regulator [Chromatiaceae bacterium]